MGVQWGADPRYPDHQKWVKRQEAASRALTELKKLVKAESCRE